MPLVVIISVIMGANCARPAPPETSASTDIEWAHYGGDAGGAKYSSLEQINRDNVVQLEVAWIVRTADFPPEFFGRSGARTGRPVNGSKPVEPRLSTRIRFETTPIMLDGTLYVSTPRNRVLALNPETGTTRWIFDPQIDIARGYAEDLTSRGVAAWTDDAAARGVACSSRIFLATIDARLFALDAADGVPCQEFGENGSVRLDVGVQLDDRNLDPSRYTITSPPTVVRDVVVIGSAVRNNSRRGAASGVVRAFDARTGALHWSFDPIPRTADHPAWSAWMREAARTTGGANVWSIISADTERDLVFLPTGSAAPDFYGGERPGRNDLANSAVALRGSTGEFVWSFQVVHHDLWDYDIAAQPLLIELRRGDHEIPAVVVGTKMGMIFVLDRESGVPILPVEERPVPTSDVPGEEAWPTQPFPTHTPLLHGTLLTPDSAFGTTPSDRAYCRDRIASLRNEGIFTPPSLQGTLVWPGFWGGINWDGLAWDPERQLIITTVKRMAMVVRLQSHVDVHAGPRGPRPGVAYMPRDGAPYRMTRAPLIAPSGMPCTPPPWGSLVALDLNGGSIRWKQPLGTVPWLSNFADFNKWGSIVFGGPLVTAGGLVFVAASQDDAFRAFDIETGNLLWKYQLPGGGQATPMTYRYKGRQYVLIAAGGRSGIGTPGDWIVAFALPW